MTDPLERLLAEGWVVPAGFEARVMKGIADEPAPFPPAPGWLERLRMLVLATGGVLAFTQAVTYLFGIWTSGLAH